MSELLQGLGVSPGTATGPAFVLGDVAAANYKTGTPDEEQAAYTAALAIGSEALQRLSDTLRDRGLEEQAGIMEAQSLMLQDPGSRGHGVGHYRRRVLSRRRRPVGR